MYLVGARRKKKHSAEKGHISKVCPFIIEAQKSNNKKYLNLTFLVVALAIGGRYTQA